MHGNKVTDSPCAVLQCCLMIFGVTILTIAQKKRSDKKINPFFASASRWHSQLEHISTPNWIQHTKQRTDKIQTTTQNHSQRSRGYLLCVKRIICSSSSHPNAARIILLVCSLEFIWRKRNMECTKLRIAYGWNVQLLHVKRLIIHFTYYISANGCQLFFCRVSRLHFFINFFQLGSSSHCQN